MKLLLQLSSQDVSKEHIVRNFSKGILKNNFILFVFESKSILQRFLFSKNNSFKLKESVVTYFTKSENSLEDMSTHLMRIRWHKQTTKFLICRSITEDEIVKIGRKCKTEKEFENMIKEYAVFYVDPIDNDLEFYGEVQETEILKDFYWALLSTGYLAKEIINIYSKLSGKEKASDIPTWAKGKKALPGEKPSETADRIVKEKMGPNYQKGTGSEYNKIKKYFERKPNCP